MTEDLAELTPEERAGYRDMFDTKQACTHCGGLHLRACRRVRSLEMRNREEIASVKFWQDGKWDETGIIWPEDVYGDDDEAESMSLEVAEADGEGQGTA